MNIFIAIVSDAYADVKVKRSVMDQTKKEVLLKKGLSEVFNIFPLNLLFRNDEKRIKDGHLTAYEIENILISCGFDLEDINVFLQKCEEIINNSTQKANYCSFINTMSKKHYTAPAAPKIPNKTTKNDKDFIPTVSYQQFKKDAEKVKQIENIIRHLNDKLDALLRELPSR
ncbi:hypothetical protein FQA39_LY01538 [Lamprigera yunnana]|nr:hypothetical protein FQA39_LY01538 [Lamprigera yunnana]